MVKILDTIVLKMIFSIHRLIIMVVDKNDSNQLVINKSCIKEEDITFN